MPHQPFGFAARARSTRSACASLTAPAAKKFQNCHKRAPTTAVASTVRAAGTAPHPGWGCARWAARCSCGGLLGLVPVPGGDARERECADDAGGDEVGREERR